jgi:hypothetical protein
MARPRGVDHDCGSLAFLARLQGRIPRFGGNPEGFRHLDVEELGEEINHLEGQAAGGRSRPGVQHERPPGEGSASHRSAHSASSQGPATSHTEPSPTGTGGAPRR